MKTKLVRAGRLPAVFTIPTTSQRHTGFPNAMARPVGNKIFVTFLGHGVLLSKSSRVRIKVES